MKYDFSTADKRKAHIKSLTDCPSNDWSRTLPNLRWMTAEEFARSRFFMYAPGTFFYQTFGGPNYDDNHAQCPEGFNKDHTHYAKAFINGDMSGDIIMADYHTQKLAFGHFEFCPHTACTSRNLGRCYNEYPCSDCGYSYSVDSSD